MPAPKKTTRKRAGNSKRSLLDAGLEKLNEAETIISDYVVESETAIRAAFLALMCKEHCLFLSPPGSAKSMIFRSISRVFTPDVNYFQRLVSKQLPREAIVGPVDLEGLTERDYRTIIEKFLPDAHIANIEEIYKASSVLLTDLLSVLQERTYDNGRETVECPLRTCFASSNEMYEGDALDALDDRFLFRVWKTYVVEKENYLRMLHNARAANAPPVNHIGLSLPELDAVIAETRKVRWDDTADEMMWAIHESFRTEGLAFSDRRSAKIAVRIVGAAALLEGRSHIEPTDFAVLEHVLWRDPAERDKVSELVLKLANPAVEECRGFQHAAKAAYDECKQLRERAGDDDATSQNAAFDYGGKMDRMLKKLKEKHEGASGSTRDLYARTFADLHERYNQGSEEFLEFLSWKPPVLEGTEGVVEDAAN